MHGAAIPILFAVFVSFATTIRAAAQRHACYSGPGFVECQRQDEALAFQKYPGLARTVGRTTWSFGCVTATVQSCAIRRPRVAITVPSIGW